MKNKAKILRNTVVQHPSNAANGILENLAIAVPLKYLSNFLRTPEIPLVNCKVELGLKWTMYCVLSAGGKDNNDDNSDNSNFDVKDTKYMSL